MIGDFFREAALRTVGNISLQINIAIISFDLQAHELKAVGSVIRRKVKEVLDYVL